MIASISTSKPHKGFPQLSSDASRRLSPFLSITLKVVLEGEEEKEEEASVFADTSSRI